jgi:hypothetical protein
MVMKHMERVCAAIGFISISSGAMAQSHPLTTAMACVPPAVFETPT